MRSDTLEYSDWNETSYQEKHEKRPVVTIGLVVINVVIWCILEFLGDTLNVAYIAKYGGIYPEIIWNGEWYRLVTAMFLHFGAEHLANNMILLAAAGNKLEAAVGSFRYLVIYIGSGLVGNIVSFYLMMRTGRYAVSAGASGAVFGIIGALAWAAIRNKGKVEGLTTKGLLLMIALCLYYGITTAGVDNAAHAGGVLGGFFLCILLYRKRQNT